MSEESKLNPELVKAIQERPNGVIAMLLDYDPTRPAIARAKRALIHLVCVPDLAPADLFNGIVGLASHLVRLAEELGVSPRMLPHATINAEQLEGFMQSLANKQMDSAVEAAADPNVEPKSKS